MIPDDRWQFFAFEKWPPNRDHEVSFDFHIPNFDVEQEFSFTLRTTAKNARPSEVHCTWKGTGWIHKPAD